MDGELVLLIMLVVIVFGLIYSGNGGRRGGCIIKDNPASKKPKVGAAPQPLRNKQGRTADEQELHEWMEDNPR